VSRTVGAVTRRSPVPAPGWTPARERDVEPARRVGEPSVYGEPRGRPVDRDRGRERHHEGGIALVAERAAAGKAQGGRTGIGRCGGVERQRHVTGIGQHHKRCAAHHQRHVRCCRPAEAGRTGGGAARIDDDARAHQRSARDDAADQVERPGHDDLGDMQRAAGVRADVDDVDAVGCEESAGHLRLGEAGRAQLTQRRVAQQGRRPDRARDDDRPEDGDQDQDHESAAHGAILPVAAA
jgi:hypothetical protein